MSEASTNKLYRTFLKGLFTEASPLTFPADTSYNEDNCEVFVSGTRTRRLGIDYESGYSLIPSVLTSAVATEAPIVEFVWRNVDKIDALHLLCQQIGNTIYFFDASSVSVSAQQKSFSIDLSSYYVSGTFEPDTQRVEMAYGKGYLFIVGAHITPLIVEYDETTDNITVSPISIKIRDLEGVDDGGAVDYEPYSLTATHNYNLLNQGWTSAHISKYKSKIGTYPGNNKQWWVGKQEAATDEYAEGAFNPELLNKSYFGTTEAPRGHFIIDPFSYDRTSVSGIGGLPANISTTRANSVCFSVGRAWYSHSTTVYFSQVLLDKNRAGRCYQKNDPTSEESPDLLADDGGAVEIPAADQIIKIVEAGNGIMVFASNGVWIISGGDQGFSAIDYRLSKVSSIGTDSPMSIAQTENQIFWWSQTGLQKIEQASGAFGTIPGAFNSVNITENTIDTFIKNISAQKRKYAKAIFDPATKVMYWLYASDNVPNNYCYDKVLLYNTIIESFHPWTLPNTGYPFISGAFLANQLQNLVASETVYDGIDVVYDGTDIVVADAVEVGNKNTFLNFSCLIPNGTDFDYTIGAFRNTDYKDWDAFDDTGVAYTSFLETGYELLEDGARKKGIQYVVPFFNTTETTYIPVGDDYTVDRPSSCYMTTRWDWSSRNTSNKWSTKIQAYRHNRLPPVDPSDLTFNSGFSVVSTRNKVRGQGRAIQIRFESDEIGKTFELLGWQVFYVGNTGI